MASKEQMRKVRQFRTPDFFFLTSILVIPLYGSQGSVAPFHG